jgi:glutathione S-transferase
MEYLMARHGPTPLAPAPNDPAFPAYQQFLHLGEAGLAMAAYILVGARQFAPESDRNSWSARQAEEQYETRLRLVRRQLAISPYMAGDAFTAADISVTYGLQLAKRGAGVTLAEPERSYVERTSARDAYKRAMDACEATKGWVASLPAD